MKLQKSIQPISIPAILAKQAWSTKELLCGFQRSFLAGRSREPRVGKIVPISAEIGSSYLLRELALQ